MIRQTGKALLIAFADESDDLCFGVGYDSVYGFNFVDELFEHLRQKGLRTV